MAHHQGGAGAPAGVAQDADGDVPMPGEGEHAGGQGTTSTTPPDELALQTRTLVVPFNAAMPQGTAGHAAQGRLEQVSLLMAQAKHRAEAFLMFTLQHALEHGWSVVGTQLNTLLMAMLKLPFGRGPREKTIAKCFVQRGGGTAGNPLEYWEQVQREFLQAHAGTPYHTWELGALPAGMIWHNSIKAVAESMLVAIEAFSTRGLAQHVARFVWQTLGCSKSDQLKIQRALMQARQGKKQSEPLADVLGASAMVCASHAKRGGLCGVGRARQMPAREGS
jgi:hypothetical protein